MENKYLFIFYKFNYNNLRVEIFLLNNNLRALYSLSQYIYSVSLSITTYHSTQFKFIVLYLACDSHCIYTIIFSKHHVTILHTRP